MKVVYVGIIKNDTEPCHELASETHLLSYSRFTRTDISNFLTLFAKTVAKTAKTRDAVSEPDRGFKLHRCPHSAGVCGIVVTDLEYPSLVADSLSLKITSAFVNKYPMSAYASFAQGSPKLAMPELKDFIEKYQDPQQADSIAKIQKELDETKYTIHETINSVLERGQKIDDLVAKSDGLSAQSKMFYTQAKKQNSCCIVM